MNLFEHLADSFRGKHPISIERSPLWRGVREDHLVLNPFCEVCGGETKLQVHHIKPFHVFPELELDPDNLITLCTYSSHRVNCHYVVGHLLGWQRWNPHVREDCEMWKRRLVEAQELLDAYKNA